MKTTLIWSFLGIVLLTGCASSAIQDRQLTREEMETAEILGSVQVNFTVMDISGFQIGLEDEIKKQAYMALLQESSQKYTGNIDVRNINISKEKPKNGFQFVMARMGVAGEATYTATGTVVSTYSNTQRTANRLGGITDQILGTFRGNSNKTTLAIFDFVNVNGKQSILGRYLAEQTSNYLFQNSELNIVERAQIEKIIQEQDFNMSGYVSDDTAVSIGKLLGASAVTVGTLTKIGNKISINIKIVETESASVLSSGSTEIDGAEYIEMYNEQL
jgi:TolB-like protein